MKAQFIPLTLFVTILPYELTKYRLSRLNGTFVTYFYFNQGFFRLWNLVA